MKRNTTFIAWLTMVFLAGVAVGVAGYRFASASAVSAQSRPSPEEYRNRYITEMRTRLQLSPEQENNLTVILDDTRRQFRDLREKHRPEMDDIQRQQTERVNAILNPTQQAEYAKMRAEREAKRKAAEQPK